MGINYNKISDLKIGINWLKSGWGMFKNNPITWIAILLTIIVTLGLLNNFFIGKFIAMLVAPFFAGGVYLTLEKSNQGNNISYLGLFSALKSSDFKKQLLLLGFIGTAVVVLDYIFHNFSLFTYQMHNIDSRSHVSLDSTFSLGGLLSWFTNVIWGIALSFTVPLVVLRQSQSLAALKISIAAVFHNVPSLVVYYIMLMILIFISIIPVGLGMFISLPVIFCASYFVFSDIFTGNTIHNITKKTLEDYKD
jgi:uncharacterized membrane protein